MKNKNLLIIVLCCFIVSLKAQLPTQRIFKGSSTDFAKSIIETRDFGFLLGGTTNSFGSGGNDVYLIKTDSIGSLLWNKTYGGTAADDFSEIKETADKGFIFIGTTNSFGANGKDIYVSKIDSLGNIQWSKKYGGANNDIGNSIIETYDNNFVLTGSKLNTTTNKTDVVLIKLNSNGDTLWSKSYGSYRSFGVPTSGPTNDVGAVIIQTSDSNYLVLSKTHAIGFPQFLENILTKFDANGNILWSRQYHNHSSMEVVFTSIQNTLDNGYILSGTNAPGGNKIILMKISNTGINEWSKNIGLTYYNNQIEGSYSLQLTDGNFLTLAPSASRNILLIKTDALGNTLLTNEYGTTAEKTGNLILCQNNQIAVSGSTNLDFYLLLVDSLLNAGCNQVSTSNSNNSVQETIGDTIVEIGMGPYGSHGMTDPFAIIPSVDLYPITISNAATIKATQNPQVSAPCFTPQEICLVTIDSLLKKNKIVWEKQYPSSFIKQYNIYSESTVVGVYNFIGSVLSDSLSEFVDLASVPLQNANRYKLTQVDLGGFESDFGTPHKTIHLTVSLGLPNQINLNWNHYEGISYNTYKIWRGNASQLILLDSINSSLNSYTDLSPTISDSIYLIEIIPTTGNCSSTARDYASIFSNTSSSNGLLTGVNTINIENGITLQPNPVIDYLIIKFPSQQKQKNMIIEIFNLLGKKVYSEELTTLESKNHKLNLSHLSNGVYLISFTAENIKTTHKILKSK